MASKTPVTILQEFMVQRHDQPVYDLIYNQVGTHEPLFKYKVTGLGEFAVGSGKSKKEAKHEAARILLLRLKEHSADVQIIKNPILEEVNTCYSPYDNAIKDNAVGALQTFCSTYFIQNPKYDLILDTGPAHLKEFTYRCTVSCFVTEATAHTKKQAKHRCSDAMLDLLKQKLCNYIDFDENDKVTSIRQDSKVNEFCNLAKRTFYFGCSQSDLCNLFTVNHYPESPTLLKLIETNEEHFPDPLELLKTICDELNFELDITKLSSKYPDTVIVNIFLISKPGWSFIAEGSSFDMAVKIAAHEAIDFLLCMSK